MIDLTTRSSQQEIMDDFDCQGEVVHQTLRELHSINTYLGGNQISLNSLRKLIKKYPREKYSFADLGCGGGDMMMLLARWSSRANHNVSFIGLDANPHIVEYARANCTKFENIDFDTADIFDKQFAHKQFDIVHCSLFLHHFSEREIVKLFSQLKKQAKIATIINDLHRHVISYYFTKWLITRWSKSAMVKYDSVVSVARSFKRKELESYLRQARISHYSLKWKWAFRWELVIYSE